ncbi:hypothetical protein ABIE44_002294 [Marmoricola sp. OAE513]|uniref:O-antigen ligase family protein n=1 Tax=Marmoricola sp. OAE513 TaxID=2817894 RepID=UPI001AE7B299
MIQALQRAVPNVVGLVVLFALLVLGVYTNSLLLSVAAVGLAVGLTVLVAVGPEKMGIGLLVLGMFTAPMNALGLSGGIGASDLLMVAGFGLLIPRLLSSGRVALPPLYVIGAGILFIGGIVSSLLAEGIVDSLVGFLKIIAATMILVFLLNLLRPGDKLLETFAWAYVLGQGVSVAYGLVRYGATHVQGRGVGLTSQPNFYGLGGQMAYALLIFLFYRVDPKHRWIVVGAMGVVGYSVIDSGSRASLLCCALITVLWPIVERSAIAWYVILSGALVAVLSADKVLSAIGQETVLDRLRGNSSAQYSDQARSLLLDQGFTLFWKHPVQGNGWGGDTILAFHNAYLQVAVGGGVITLLGFVLVVTALVRPLFTAGAPNRLAYAGLSYAAFGMIGPTLYDRIVWAALALILVSSANVRPEVRPEGAEPDLDLDAGNDTQSKRQPPR